MYSIAGMPCKGRLEVIAFTKLVSNSHFNLDAEEIQVSVTTDYILHPETELIAWPFDLPLGFLQIPPKEWMILIDSLYK